MLPRSHIFTAKRIVLLNFFAISGYIIWVGPERFSIESFGTLMLSPVVYSRLLPPPLNSWLLYCLFYFPVLTYIICIVPIILLAASIVIAAFSILKKSVFAALLSVLITTVVFGVYHCVQPFGFSFYRQTITEQDSVLDSAR